MCRLLATRAVRTRKLVPRASNNNNSVASLETGQFDFGLLTGSNNRVYLSCSRADDKTHNNNVIINDKTAVEIYHENNLAILDKEQKHGANWRLWANPVEFHSP